MVYQIDGKMVTEKPIGKFKKIVTIPGKLMNFLTKIPKNQNNKDFWLNNNHINVGKDLDIHINGVLI